MTILCYLLGHKWANDHKHPVYGAHSLPYPDSYCKRCKLPALESYVQE